MDSPVGDPDRISALPDDVLHLILGFLPEATVAARTAVLSRRWRHLWVHAQKLELSYLAPALGDSDRVSSRPGYFAGFVDQVFARRGDAAIGSLQIRLWNHHCTPPTKVAEWTHYAVHHVVDSFILCIMQKPAATVELELPSHGKTRFIYLNLSGMRLRFPPSSSASMYGVLTELVLNSAVLGEATGGLVGDFVSSCCPRLSKLAIGNPVGLRELVLRVDALEELRLSRAEDLRTLDVTAPNLRVLCLDRCFFHGAAGNGVSASRVACRVVAPRLQVISMHDWTLAKLPDMDIHDLASVRCLDLCLVMSGGRCRRRSAGLWLLENCPGVQHVQVSLDHRCDSFSTIWFRFLGTDSSLTAGDLEVIDLGAKDAAPFASVTSLKVDKTSIPESYVVPSITSLLLRCPRLTSLSINSNLQGTRCDYCYCENNPSGNHRGKISLGFLEEVEISGFRGTKEEMDLVSMLFESSSSIKRMTVLTGAAEITGYEELERITCSTSRGRWDVKEGVYTWTYYAAEVEAEGGINN